MAKIETNYAAGRLPAPIPVAQEILSVKSKITLTAAQSQVANVLSFAVLPADCRIVDYIITSSDIDSGTTAQLSLGVLNAAETALSANLLTNSTIGQAGGIATGHDSKANYDAVGAIAPVSYDRKVGVTNNAIAGGLAGSIELELYYQSV